MKEPDIASRGELERELAACEHRISLIRRLIGDATELPRGPRTTSSGRPNAGIGRFILEAVRRNRGIHRKQIAAAMAAMGFQSTPTRSLEEVIAHELRTLIKAEEVREADGFWPTENVPGSGTHSS